MKAGNPKKIMLIVLSAVLVAASPVPAAVIENVRFETAYEGHGVRLPLQGTGLFRYLGFIKAYVGALYYEGGLSTEDILTDRPKRLEVEYFYALKGEDFGKVTDRFLADNADAATLARIRPQVDFHNALYRDVQPGDRYALTYVPGRGTELALNGEVLGVIPGAEFAAVLFAMWLGDAPMNEDFKRQLLGGS